MNDDMIQKFLETAKRLQDAVSDFQTSVVELDDFGRRIRAMTEKLQESGGGFDDPGLIRLPTAIMPKKPAA